MKRTACLALFLLVGMAAESNAAFILASNLTNPPSYSSFDIGIGFSGDTSNGFFANEAAGQEFRAGASGQVGNLTVSVFQIQPQGVPLVASIYTASNGTIGTLLGSKTFAPSQISPSSSNSPSTLDMTSANIFLTSGQLYIATFTVLTPITDSNRYFALLLNTSSSSFGFNSIFSTDGGATFRSEGIPNEIGLSITQAVPEASSLVLCGISGLVGLGTARLRNGLRRSRPH